jgi:hypothetical protein
MSSVLNKFDSLVDLNEYYINSFNANYSVVKIEMSSLSTFEEFFSAHSDIPSSLKLYQAMFNAYISGDDLSEFYYLPCGKTQYRRIFHSNLPDSLYKKFFKSFQKNGYIIDSSSSFIFLVKKKVSPELFIEIASESLVDSDLLLKNLVIQISDLKEDNKYYISKIKDLEMSNQKILQALSDAEQLLHNKSMSTWY